MLVDPPGPRTTSLLMLKRCLSSVAWKVYTCVSLPCQAGGLRQSAPAVRTNPSAQFNGIS